MRRALVAPLLSGLVLPGLGQVINRQTGKGTLLMIGSGMLFLVSMGLMLYHFSTAVLAVEEAGGQATMEAIHQQITTQGAGWLWIFLPVIFVLWAYAVWDAWRWGRIRDAEALESK
ncbi:MAG: hypothetical protein KQJ78_06520 [Deltaproteobacteria bacterium]|nr:hypothetical protein [Deltaproteobacteria bacterium]